MEHGCLELINLYNNLLSKKEGFYNSLGGVNKDNVKDLKKFIVEINKDISEIKNIFYCKKRIEFFVDFYEELGIELEDDIFNDVVIPEKPQEGEWSLLFIEPKSSARDIFKSMSKKFSKCDNTGWKTTELQEREKSGKPYAIWVENAEQSSISYNGVSICVDGVDNKDVSDLINSLKKNNIATMTLKERFVFELLYFQATYQHLDDVDKRTDRRTFEITGNSSTLCVESCVNGFMIPLVSWYDRSMNVNSASFSYSRSDMRVRVVVL